MYVHVHIYDHILQYNKDARIFFINILLYQYFNTHILDTYTNINTYIHTYTEIHPYL
jgi:hypothetical protein